MRTGDPKVRRKLLARDGHNCGICGESLGGPLLVFDARAVHVDHIVPFDIGGGHELSNLQLAHADCNIRKGARAA